MPSHKTSTSVGKKKMSAASHAAVDNQPSSNDVNSPLNNLRAKKRSTSRKGRSVTPHRTKKAASRSKAASKKGGRSHVTISAKGRRSTADRKKGTASRRRHAKK